MKRIQLFLVVVFSIIYFQNAYSHVALDYPKGGETFQGEEIVTIQWHVVVAHGPANWDLFFSEDGGNSWIPIALDLPLTQLSYDWTVPNTATNSGEVKVVQDNETGVVYSDASGNFTIIPATGINEYNYQADNFVLYPAYPNPFNPSTVISWQLPVGGQVKLSIYNLVGQKIAVLVNEHQPAGRHSIEWNAAGLPSGVYFYRLEATGYVEARKMMLKK